MNSDSIPKNAHTDSELIRERSGELIQHDGAVSTAMFNGDGNFFFTGGEDRVIRICDTRNGNVITSFHEHEREVYDVCVAADDSKVSSCGGDGKVLYWDLSTRCLVRKFGGHNEGVNAVKFNEFGTVIVSADSCVRLWDCRSHSSEPIQIFDSFKDSVTSVCLSGPAEFIAGSLDGSVQKFDLRNNTQLSHDLGSPVTSISMGNTGTCLVASCRGSAFQLLNVRTKSIRAGGAYHGHKSKSSKLGCCFNKDTTHVVGGSEDGRIFFWDLLSKLVVSEFDAHSTPVTSVDYHPTEDWMVSASMDGTVVLWKDLM